jgi:hypothetical protein
LITFCSTARPENLISCQVPAPEFCAPGACSINCDIWRPFTAAQPPRLVHIDALTGRAEIDHIALRDDGDRLGDTGGLQLEIEREILSGHQLETGVFQRRKLAKLDSQRVRRRFETGHDISPVGVADGGALFPGSFVLDGDGDPGNDRP